MRIYVINCCNDRERREAARTKLQRAGVRFEFFDGLSADDALDRHVFDAINHREFLINTGRQATDGEIGCFASHREIWKRAAVADEAVVVMEDDFELLGDFTRALSVVAKLIEHAGFIRLQTDLRAKKKPVVDCAGFRLSRFTKAPHGTMCYGLSPAVATSFVDATRVLDAPVDVFIKKYWEHKQPLYVLTPCPVGPSRHHGASTIGGREKVAKPLPVALRRVLRKAGWHVGRWRFGRTCVTNIDVAAAASRLQARDAYSLRSGVSQ